MRFYCTKSTPLKTEGATLHFYAGSVFEQPRDVFEALHAQDCAVVVDEHDKPIYPPPPPVESKAPAVKAPPVADALAALAPKKTQKTKSTKGGK